MQFVAIIPQSHPAVWLHVRHVNVLVNVHHKLPFRMHLDDRGREGGRGGGGEGGGERSLNKARTQLNVAQLLEFGHVL